MASHRAPRYPGPRFTDARTITLADRPAEPVTEPISLIDPTAKRAMKITGIGFGLVLLVGIVIVVALTGTSHSTVAASAGSSSSSSSSTTTPLGCSVHPMQGVPGVTATDDPYCTQRQLASRLCGLDLGDPYYSDGGLVMWQGRFVAAESDGRSGSTVSFTCIDGDSGGHHANIIFTDQEWSQLLAPGNTVPARWATTLGS